MKQLRRTVDLRRRAAVCRSTYVQYVYDGTSYRNTYGKVGNNDLMTFSQGSHSRFLFTSQECLKMLGIKKPCRRMSEDVGECRKYLMNVGECRTYDHFA